MKTNAILLAALCCVVTVSAHQRWVTPPARTQDDGLKGPYPCGGMTFGSGTRTSLAPGPNVVFWEETICHRGAPFRIALSVNSDSNYDQHILFDHILHNDASDCSPPKPYAFRINVPDINCPKCAIQLLQIMTDKLLYYEQTYCDYPEALPADLCQSVYHSCADIAITGKGDPLAFNTTNPPYRSYEAGEATTWVFDGSVQRWVLPANWGNVTAGAVGQFGGQSLFASLLLFLGVTVLASVVVPRV